MCLLDLFCGAGGAATGYYRAGFTEIVGVDIKPQPRYPFEFVQADALAYVAEHGHEFDVIHASPPCQAYTQIRYVTGRQYPELIEPTREALCATGKPYVIENVPGAPLIADMTVWLAGTMFGLKVFRWRGFESNVLLLSPKAFPNARYGKACKQGRAPVAGQFITVTGNFSGQDYARDAMGIDWMTRKELTQAIPPAYTECIGLQLLAFAQRQVELEVSSG
jgi:DNA (cytosine-5)-methyltransferase 1